MTDLIDSIKKWLSERSSSPFFASFLVAWILFNWEPLYLLATAQGQFEYIVEMVRCRYWVSFFSIDSSSCKIHFYPAISALLWTVVYPHASRYLLVYALWTDALLKKSKFKMESITPISGEERDELLLKSRELENETRDLREKHGKEITKLNQIIDALQNKQSVATGQSASGDVREVQSTANIDVRPNYTLVLNKVTQLNAAVKNVVLPVLNRQKSSVPFAANRIIYMNNKLTKEDKQILANLPALFVGSNRIGCDEIVERAEELFGEKFDGTQILNPDNPAPSPEVEVARSKVFSFLNLTQKAIEGLRQI